MFNAVVIFVFLAIAVITLIGAKKFYDEREEVINHKH